MGPRRRPLRAALPLALFTLASLPIAAPVGRAQDLVLEGDVPDGPETHFFLPFEVPEGTVEIEVRHDDRSDDDVLDWGLDDGEGHRGWGGGNREPAVVGLDRASRSYVPGPIASGTWEVVVGKAQLRSETPRYRVEVFLRDAPTLEAQPERAPFVAPAPLEAARRWYAGDFHVHSRESGDASASLDEIATLAEARGLDFVVVTDHNVHTALDFFAAVQARHPTVLLVPGVELTTYAGHANGIGATEWVDHRLGVRGATMEAAADAYHAQGALLSLNHPALNLPSCIGCAWTIPVDPADVDAVEIQNTAVPLVQALFLEAALRFWDDLLSRGAHAAALGGSDDHSAGVDLGDVESPVGDPTTRVLAEALSVEALVEAVRAGRTVVQLQGPDGPMVVPSSSIAPQGDTVRAPSTQLSYEVTGASGGALAVLRNGVVVESFTVDADPYVARFDAIAPASGEDRYRAELEVDGVRRAVTSHLFVARPAARDDGGCAAGGGVPPAGALGGVLLPATWIVGRRRARRCRRG